MIGSMRKEQCTGCSACVNICPKKCIRMVEDPEGFQYPQIEESACAHCGLCEKACPVLHLQRVPASEFPSTYLAWTTNVKDLHAGTSGGVFTSIARVFLEEGGAVVGAAYDVNHVVKHIMIESVADLYSLSRSKYVQSDVGDVYRKVGDKLLQGKQVLFCGMACQVYGLISYLALKTIDLTALYTCDLICVGVPSPKLFREYVHWHEKSAQYRIMQIKMREKVREKKFFSSPSVYIEFDNGKTYLIEAEKDYYSRLFLNKIATRPSCHVCPFKTTSRISDLSLGDCWFSRSLSGKKEIPFDVTLCLLHTEKGNILIEQNKNLSVVSTDPEKSIKANGGMIYSCSVANTNRSAFFNELGVTPIDKLANQYFPQQKKQERMPVKILKVVIKSIPGFYRYYYFRKMQKEYDKRCARSIPQNAIANTVLSDK